MRPHRERPNRDEVNPKTLSFHHHSLAYMLAALPHRTRSYLKNSTDPASFGQHQYHVGALAWGQYGQGASARETVQPCYGPSATTWLSHHEVAIQFRSYRAL